MKNTNSQVLRKTFAFSLVRFTLVRFTLARFTLVRFVLVRFVLAAILIPALLIGSAFTFGGSKLQAQANGSPNGQSSKQGFFVGIVYLNGFKVDSTKTVTTKKDTIASYKRKGYSAVTSEIIADASTFWDDTAPFGLSHSNGIEALLKKSCEEMTTEAVSVEADGRTYFYGRESLFSFDAGTSRGEGTSVTTTGDGSGTVSNNFPSGNGNNGQDTNYCYSYFYGDASAPRTIFVDSDYSEYKVTEDSAPVSQVTNSSSSKGDSISGIGLQFSFRWEKWRASLTHFTGSGGANELTNTLVMADYFVNKDFFVGGGLASMKLQNSQTSGSATSPAIQIGYKKNLTPNLFFNFGLTKYISGVSLSHTTYANNQTAPTTGIIFKKQTKDGDSAVVGARIKYGVVSTQVFSARVQLDNNGVFKRDTRTRVTQVYSRTVNIEEILKPATETTTKSDAELKAPLVISLSFHLSF